MLNKARLILKHLWLDAGDARRAVPADMLERLARRVAASEGRHTGQIRICVEASLPMSYLWRLGRGSTMGQLVRQRAMMLFGKLGVWDTGQNNGVLIYLQLAEHAIEIVADRALARHVPTEQWQAMVGHMSKAFREQRFEDGLTEALEEVSALLVMHFPAQPGQARSNEQPDMPLVS